MKALGIEVNLTEEQVTKFVNHIKDVYPEVYARIHQEGWHQCDVDSYDPACICPDCDNQMAYHCWNCDPYPT